MELKVDNPDKWKFELGGGARYLGHKAVIKGVLEIGNPRYPYILALDVFYPEKTQREVCFADWALEGIQ